MANPSGFLTINLNVFNKSSNQIKVTGINGTDLSNVQMNSVIPAIGGQLIVAQFSVGNKKQDRWDWVYLTDLGTNTVYQIYIEVTAGFQTPYAFFGYYNPQSSESNSNPSPFPPGYALVAWDGDVPNYAWTPWQDNATFNYILVDTPPSN